MGWIWPVLAFAIVVVIIAVSLRLSARRSPDLPEMKGEASRPPNIFYALPPMRRRYGGGRR
jgi:hypothetical protein